MSQLLESIYINNGRYRNLTYHEARMRNTLKRVHGLEFSMRLHDLLSEISVPASGLFKVRIIYDIEVRKIDYVPYFARPVNSLKLIHDDSISYNHKFLDRIRLNSLFDQRESSDDILIVRNGLITDTWYANVIFKKQGRWFTPDSYLLNGTMRQSLLDVDLIEETHIDISDLKQYQSAKLINSMLGMDGPEILIHSIS